MSERWSDVDGTFAERFKELYVLGYGAAYGVLGNAAEAEDCAQEALARALVRWSRIESYSPAWVTRVAVNLALDRLRVQRRADTRAVPASEIRADADLADRRHDLAIALEALPRRQREAIVLRYLVGLPEADTADTMGCTIGTVKSTTARGLTRMRGRLGPQWAWED